MFYNHRTFGTTTGYCHEHIKELMKGITEPKITISQSDVYYPERPDHELESAAQIGDPKKGRTDFHEEEIQSIRDVVQSFECLICKGIPISPHECNVCEVIYCKDCIENHKSKTQGLMSRRCPHCKQIFQAKTLNRNLLPMTIEKLKFRHRCMPLLENNQDQEKDDSKLSAFDKFKRTAQYRQILIKLGKIPATEGESAADRLYDQEQILNQIDDNNERRNGSAAAQNSSGAQRSSTEQGVTASADTQSKMSKRAQKQLEKQSFKSTRLQKLEEERKKKEKAEQEAKEEAEKKKKEDQEARKKEKENELRQEKIMKYYDYINHLKYGDCPQFKKFECPANCDVDSEGPREKYSYEKLEAHLRHDCPNMMIKCFNCNYKEIRSKFPKKHLPKNCVKILQEKNQEINKEYRLAKKRRRQLVNDHNRNQQAAANENQRERNHPFGEFMFEEPYHWDQESPSYRDLNDDFEQNPFSLSNSAFRRDASFVRSYNPFSRPDTSSRNIRSRGLLRDQRYGESNERAAGLNDEIYNRTARFMQSFRGGDRERGGANATGNENNSITSASREPFSQMIRLMDSISDQTREIQRSYQRLTRHREPRD